MQKKYRIGVVGGGQLARMMVPPATELDIDLRLLVEDYNGSAASVWPRAVVGDPKNLDDLRRLAYGLDGRDIDKVDALTFEHEHIPHNLLKQIEAEGFLVTPKADALIFAQDKLKMREKMAKLGIPQPKFAEVRSASEVMQFVKVHGKSVLKAATGGYDGKGVWFVEVEDDIPQLQDDKRYLVEEMVQFETEVSLLTARSKTGEVKSWGKVLTTQQNGVCKTAVADEGVIAKSFESGEVRIAERIAEELDVVGVLAVEMFQTKDGELLVNELAMRPHNTGHWTINGAVTSQFEQHLRACLGLPLGSTALTSEVTVMENILGSNRETLSETLTEAQELDSRLRVNLYGKGIRPGRKLGHINICGKHEELEELKAVAKRAAGLFENDPEQMGNTESELKVKDKKTLEE